MGPGAGAPSSGGGHGDEIVQIPQPEEVPRLLGELGQLSAGLCAIGVEDPERWRILTKCALDGMTSMRRRILDVLLGAGSDYRTTTVAARCRMPGTSVRRHLQDQNALGIIDLTGTDPETWRAGDWLRGRWSDVTETSIDPAPSSASEPLGDLSDPDYVAGGLVRLDHDESRLMERRFAERWPTLKPLHLDRMGWAPDVRRWRPEVRPVGGRRAVGGGTSRMTDAFQLLPGLAADEYAASKADIAAHGVRVPVVVDAETGAIIDGYHRVRVVDELRAEGHKVPDYPRQVVRFANDDERAAFALAANLLRRHLTRRQRVELAVALRARGWSERRIAEALGVGAATVHRDLGLLQMEQCPSG